MLRELTILQFRSHRRATLKFDARPVAIHGPNGAGKTNILEAMSLLSPGRGLRRAQSDDLMRRDGSAGGLVGWKLRAATDRHEIETSALPGEPRKVEIDGKTAPQVALAPILRVLWLVPAMDRLWIEGAEGRRRFLDRMVMSFVPAHAEATLAYDKAMRERNRLLRDMVRDPVWYHALEGQMVEAADAIRANRDAALIRIAQARAGIGTAFPAADLALDNAGPEDLAAALEADRGRDMAAGRTLEGPHRADLSAVYAEKAMPAAQCSTGEQKALLISLILANARALAGENVVLLLDEVAAHLDSARRAALYDEICAMDAQVMMTGTGAELFDNLGLRGRYLEVIEGPGHSAIREVGP